VNRRIVAAVIGTAVLVFATYAAAPDVGRRSDGSPTAPFEQALRPGPGVTERDELERAIRAYEGRLATRPDSLEYTFLGRLYLDKARLTGDVETYDRAATALTEAARLAPRDLEAHTLLATVRFSTHDFVDALAKATEILGWEPGHLPALAVVGDAHLELGDYAEATQSYDRLAGALPDTAGIEVRRARLAFLNGDLRTARRLARDADLAARKAGAAGADLAWYTVFRGQLELETGHYGAAAAFFESALRTVPDHRLAVGGLARARAATGETDEAISLYERAVAQVPDPEYVTALGDLYAATGHSEAAKHQYDTIEVIATLAKANRQVFGRQLAMYYADHGLQPAEALRLAAAELEVRKDVYGYDAYAWALYQSGRYEEAQHASDAALRLGTPDARLHYHAGLIAAALGDLGRARTALRRALDISPAFHPLQAPHARSVLISLSED